MNTRTTLMCGICSLGLFAGRAETYHATEGTLNLCDPSLAVYYPFDDANALGKDFGPNACGTLDTTGTPAFKQDGVRDGYCEFAGKGYFAGAQPSTIPTGKSPFSICFWAKTSSKNASNRAMIGFGDASGNATLCDLILYGDNSTPKITQVFCKNGGWEKSFIAELTDGHTFQDGWHSVVFVYDGVNRTYYLDGQLALSEHPAYTWGNYDPAVAAGTLNIGNGTAGGFNRNKYEGSLDDLAIYNRALTADDAAAYHATGVAAVSPTSVEADSTFIADADCTVCVPYGTVAQAISGAGTIKSSFLTVTGSVGGGVTVDGSLALGDGVTLDASAPVTVTDVLTVRGGATVSLAELPARLPASIQVVRAASVSGGENVASWTVADLPDGVSAVFSTSDGSIDVVLAATGAKGRTYRASTGTAELGDASLAVYYPFDDANALGKDKGPHDYPALAEQGSGASPSYIEGGKFGGACRFSNANYYKAEVFPAALPVGSASFTVCYWLKCPTYTYDSSGGVVSWGKNGFAQSNDSMAHTYVTAKKVAHCFAPNNWDPSGVADLPEGQTFQDGWHSVVETYDATTHYRRIYLDGQKIHEAIPISKGYNDGYRLSPNVQAQDFQIGRSVAWESKVNAWIDELAVFDRALSDGEAAGFTADGVKGVDTAIPAGSFFFAENGATVVLRQPNTVAAGIGGAGVIRAEQLSVGASVADAVTVEGDLTLADGIVVVADAKKTVTGALTIGGSGTVTVTDVPTSFPAVVRLFDAGSIVGAEQLKTWMVEGLPDGLKGGVTVNGTTVEVCIVEGAFGGTVYHASANATLDLSDPALAVYYPFDDAAALGTDRSAHANGTLAGTPSFTASGKFGGAAEFGDGKVLTSEGATVPASLPQGRAPFSVCFFAKSTSPYLFNRGAIAWGARGFAKVNEVAFMSDAKNGIWHMFAPETWDRSAQGALPSGTFDDGGWHSVVVTYDPVAVLRRVYMDGTKVLEAKPISYSYNDGATITPNVTLDNFLIGSSLIYGYHFLGYLDEVAVFDRTLTDAEAGAYHQKGIGCSAQSVAADSVFIAEEGATISLNETATAASIYGAGTVVTPRLRVGTRLGAGGSVTGDLVLADGVALERGVPRQVSGTVTIRGKGSIDGVEGLELGSYVLLRATAFAGTENLKGWRGKLSDGNRYTVSVVGNELVLTVVGGGMLINIR